MFQVEHHLGPRLLERDRDPLQNRLGDLAADDAAVRLLGFDRLGVDARAKDPGVRRHLPVGPSPEKLHFWFEPAVELTGAGKQRRSEHGPGKRSPDQDERDGDQAANGH